MKFTHNIISKYLFLFLLLLFVSVHSSAIAGDATSFDPTSVAVEPKAISGVPIGGVIPWTSGTVPEGFLECNGQSTSGYTDLAAIVGGTVPDLRGEFIRGWDHGKGVDSGRAIKSSQNSAMESHSHQTTITVSGSGIVRGATKSMMVSAGGFLTGAGTPANQAISFSASGTGTSTPAGSGTENRPRNYSMMYIIKAE
ncbi:Phage Tail Collar Domain [Maridesulfovibrio ferrireducens]|uniref:Phage Tail Collar Domain n=1 Tax=Maridesulfovibrio ferrireducens TaxID=246191 RepID=A0A1G9ENY1_9BACT|nr:phage tail protein [Maridesulfovibrio ferrireducens]SDK77892.1 Phage Tail Collar Domain [Maridesulfovibrio ferrireducens]